MTTRSIIAALAGMTIVLPLLTAGEVSAQTCPEKNLIYWQAFPAGGESDISGRHQQVLLKKRCPKIEMVMQYKPGAGGGLLWGQLNGLPGDGYNIAGVNLPHIFLQPLEGEVQYKTEDITPVFWFHYTPDAIVVSNDSPIKTFQDLIKLAKAQPGKLTLAGSGTNSANHVAHEKLNGLAGIQTTYVPFKGTGDLTTAVIGQHVTGAMSYSAFAINTKEKVRALAVALDKRHPLLPDVPGTGRRLGRWRLSRHRCAEIDAARSAQADFRSVGRAQCRSGNEGTRVQERFRTHQHRHRQDGCLYERTAGRVSGFCEAAGPGEIVLRHREIKTGLRARFIDVPRTRVNLPLFPPRGSACPRLPARAPEALPDRLAAPSAVRRPAPAGARGSPGHASPH